VDGPKIRRSFEGNADLPREMPAAYLTG